MSIKSEIIHQFTQVAEEQNKQLAPLRDDVPLLDSGLDSLCLAVIVARLDEVLGVDPFSTADNVGFPVTFGDFVQFYENATQSAEQKAIVTE